MGRIKKVAGAKHELTLSPALSDFIKVAVGLPLIQLSQHLKTLEWEWPYPRGDLYHWIPLLNHFDCILDEVVKEYDLREGPQTRPFTHAVLHRGIPDVPTSVPSGAETLPQPSSARGDDGELVGTIVSFSKVLHENCGNRSLYSSSEHLGHLLKSVDIELVATVLQLAHRLAVRYNHACHGGQNGPNFTSNTLRLSHYNLNLDHLQQLVDPVVKSRQQEENPRQVLPSGFQGLQKERSSSADFAAPSLIAAGPGLTFPTAAAEGRESSDLVFTWINQPSPDDAVTQTEPAEKESPSKAAQARSTNRPLKPSRLSSAEDSRSSAQALPAKPNEQTGDCSIRIANAELRSKSACEILAEHVPNLPVQCRSDFLVQVREAKIFVVDPSQWQIVLATRILAMTNLSYVVPEQTFLQRVLQRDSDQPRQFQIIQQLTDLVQPPGTDEAVISSSVRAMAIECLEAIAKLKSKTVDVCGALNINVSHGVLLYVARKTIANLSEESGEHEHHAHFHEALVSLLETLCTSAAGPRTCDSLVGAGLLEILVDSLKLRTPAVERGHHRVLGILNLTVNSAREGLQTFSNCKGLDVVSDLFSWQVSSAIERANNGQGLPQRYKSQVTDFSIQYYQQQTLRGLLKFVNHLMSHTSTHFERLLRNLIDSPALLKGLREILANGKVFGSAVWSAAVNVLSSFIHNEPTSYAVIAEAGLSKTLLEAIMTKPLETTNTAGTNETNRSIVFTRIDEDTIKKRSAPPLSVSPPEDWESSEINVGRSASEPLAQGILPATDAINAIPTVFGAICLHNSGLDMLLNSGVIEKFFEIFENYDHVMCLAADSSIPKNLGQSFDELVRHHPRLKNAVTEATILMVARLERFCLEREKAENSGARLENYHNLTASKQKVASGTPTQHGVEENSDITMMNSSNTSEPHAPHQRKDVKTTTYLGIMARFLTGFFENQTWCGSFISAGGLDFLLGIGTSPALPYDFSNIFEVHDLFHVFHLLVEYKPHLVLPAFVTRLTTDVRDLEPLMQHDRPAAFFSPFTNVESANETADGPSDIEGTKTLKAMVNVHVMTNILHEAFVRSPYTSRSSHTLFSQMNLTDYYIPLVKDLGRLHRACVWEEIQLQNAIGEKLRQETRINGYGMGSDEADEVFGFRQASDGEENQDSVVDEPNSAMSAVPQPPQRKMSAKSANEPDEAIHKNNVQALRFLLSQIPSCITPFLQSLGRALVPRRRIDPFQRQNAFMVANAIAEVAVGHLEFEVAINSDNTKDRTAYLVVAITSVTHLLVEGADGSAPLQCLTLLLHAFKGMQGLKKTGKLLETFAKPLKDLEAKELLSSGVNRGFLGGLKLILAFYGQITSGRYITDSQQSQTLGSPDREHDSPYYFSPAQLLVELRFIVLTAVRPLWESSLIDNAPSLIVKSLIEILRTCWDTEQERTMPPALEGGPPLAAVYMPFLISSDKEATLKARGVPAELARESLFRCMNGRDFAEEYCTAHMRALPLPKLPIPSYELERTSATTSGPSVRRQGSEDTIPDAESASMSEIRELSSQLSEAPGSVTQTAVELQGSTNPETDVGDGMAMSIDNLLNLRETPGVTESAPTDGESTEAAPQLQQMPFSVPCWEFGIHIATKDLDHQRSGVRGQLVERALDILSSHDDLTFELAALLKAAASSSPDADGLRAEMGPLLVQSLVSMTAEDLASAGSKIAALANLLAIVIQEKEFFDTTVSDLQGQFSQLLSFIRVVPSEKGDTSAPWIGQTLLVMEKLLAEDAQPEQIKWSPPTSNSPEPETPVVEMEDPLVSESDKQALFQSLMDIIPHVNKDQGLALSILRVLVILSRGREIIARLAEKQNVQKLFLMMKQLAGQITEKLQSTFLLVLRHLVEDDECIRKIMKSEIVQCFQTHRSRPMDTTHYIRNMHAHVLRAPSIFLEVTNEMVKIDRFESNQRPQGLVLKENAGADTKTSKTTEEVAGSDEKAHDHIENSSKDSDQVQLSTEGGDTDEKVTPSAVEAKLPILEHSNGVVHFMLSQLLTYDDVDDIIPKSPKKTDETEPTSTEMDVDSSDNGSRAASSSIRPTSKLENPETKPENHPIFFYRVLLLQCLSELLSCYSLAKVEFINFSPRKSESKTSTPSKPRSAILNYILQSLVPTTRIDKQDNVPSKKSQITSNWAMSVLVSLCVKTHETAAAPKRDMADEPHDPTLSFVRKFVLEQSLKIFKDALVTSEPVQVKHSRLASFADLFMRMLNGRKLPPFAVYGAETSGFTIKEVSKLMFEKGYIGALTNSISDIDLNLESAKRLVKYVLRPLKTLTQSAVQLSETSELSSSPGATDEDDISTATSMTEDEEDREETPDLYRNSVLSIAAGPDEDEDSGSGSEDEDEEMYDDDYDDTMDYEDGVEHDHGEVISDEDEEVGDAGDIEGVPGDGGMHVTVVNLADEDDLNEDDADDSENDVSDEDDEDIDDEDMDTDHELDMVEEINADDENASLADGEDFDDDDDVDDTSGPPFPTFPPVGIEMQEGGLSPADHLDIQLNIIDDGEDDDEPPGTSAANGTDFRSDGHHTFNLDFSMDADIPHDEDDAEDDDDDDDDDDIDDIEEEEIVYPSWAEQEAEMVDEDQPPWGWDDEGPIIRRNIRTPGQILGHHHHHHHHHGEAMRTRVISPWEVFPSRHPNEIRSQYRSLRNAPGIRAADDNVNPLLRRSPGNEQPARQPQNIYPGPATFVSDFLNLGGGSRDATVSLINNIMHSSGLGGETHAGDGIDVPHRAFHFHFDRQGGLMAFPPNIHRIINRPAPEPTSRSSREEPFHQPTFFPLQTSARWGEEARLLYGSNAAEKVQRVVNSLLKMLVPAALEEERIRKEQEEEARRKKEEEAATAREEKLAKDKAEREERERREKEEMEAKEAAERRVAEQQTLETSDEASTSVAMEGVESTTTTNTGAAEAAGESSAPQAPPSEEQTQRRVLAHFGEREVDITHLGIDQDYLDALPEELREEVLMQAFADQRSQQASSGQAPTDIDREFLEALPPNIREEILAQEAQDRRRREREEARRRAAANNGPANARAEEMDTASFFASLDPMLRSAVLLDQDDDMLAQLPPPIAAEARSLLAGRMQQWGEMPRNERHDHSHQARDEIPVASDKKPPRRRIVQMLDKGGIATLLRMLFVSPQSFSRDVLNTVLDNAAQNRQNRQEILGILLSILQEGTVDASSVEKSFVNLSLRAKQHGSQKTPQPLRRTLSGQASVTTVQDMTPLSVIQHCLGALCYLTERNPHAPTFFLTENDSPSHTKIKTPKKGKSKESQESKFPLNALLSLLDRKLVMDSATCMEQLSSLLQGVTQPLQLLRHQKDEATEKRDGSQTDNGDSLAADNNAQVQKATSGQEAPGEGENAGAALAASNAGEGGSVNKDSEGADTAKKQRRYTPPFVPEHNLRLVVNILSARECNGKTFRDTLSAVNNLSVIPGAKEVFGKELVNQSQKLAVAITKDLEILIQQIHGTSSGHDVHGMALAKFSPTSSDQVKLLRVLTALDYIFDPKRNHTKQADADKNIQIDSSKADILANLYESWAFVPLWTRLSECLRSMRQKSNLPTTATVLLPLIEALMVVCKNTQIEDQPMTATKDFQIMSPAPEGSMQGLFFRFTEEHRKVLNDLVRQSPRLMSGTFSLLVKNPKVLEFDNKRNYFTRRLHSRSDMRRPQPPLQLSVRREQTFQDSYAALYYKSADEIKYGKLNIRFHGEEGVDAGGVSREWFQTMSRQMFNADFALFTPVASDRTTFHPNKDSYYNEFHLDNFKFIGRIIGKALYEGRALDCHFSRAVYKRILGKSVSLKDMETLDLEYYRSLVWMLENDISDIITETFSVETDVFGAKEVIDLIEGGRSIPVTEENKQEYVQRVVEYRLVGSVKEQLDIFLKGFHEIVPAELIAIFNEQELELLISGLPDIDVDDWKANTEYHNYSASSAQIQWFWRAVRSFDKEERAKLLQFITGTAKVPLNGFKELEGMNGISRFNIHRDYGNKQRLPSSHTCFNQLDLPEYDDYETLRQQIYTAITAGSQYFGFA